MKYISIICLIIGLILAGIWIAQEVSTLDILDNPSTGAGIFLLLGFIVNVLSRRKTES